MNLIDIITNLIKTLGGIDTNPTDANKPWYLKRTYWGLLVTVVSAALYYWRGLVLDNDMLDIMKDNVEVVRSSLDALISAITTLYGIYLLIKGKLGQDKKVKMIANEMAQLPPQAAVPFPEVVKK